MENASKALLIAGGMLIALMVISALVYLFVNLSEYQNSNERNLEEKQLVEFNKEYTTYDRSGVRGSDLLSLMNKAIDYNKRKADFDTNDIKYEPITINLTFVHEGEDHRSKLTSDDTIRLFKSQKYVINTNVQNSAIQAILNNMSNLENTYGSEAIQKLASNINSIIPSIDNRYDTEDQKEDKMKKAIDKFNSIIIKSSQEITYVDNYTSINSKYNQMISNHKENISRYYEYAQFKRGSFDCVYREYSQETGRIIRLDFEFTGSFK